MTKDELVEQNLKLAYRLANKYYKICSGKVEFEEIRSASLLGLVKAANSFDETRGLAFSTYAFPCIKNEILMYLRASQKYNNISLYSQITDDIILEDTLKTKDDTEEIILKNLEIDLLYKYIHKLPELEKKIILYHLKGKTTQQIGKILGYSQPHISRLYHKALNRLRDNFKD